MEENGNVSLILYNGTWVNATDFGNSTYMYDDNYIVNATTNATSTRPDKPESPAHQYFE